MPDNGYVESFNGRMRDELLNESLFFGLGHARSAITEWVQDFNTMRPHSSFGYQTPAVQGMGPEPNWPITCMSMACPRYDSMYAPPDGVDSVWNGVAASGSASSRFKDCREWSGLGAWVQNYS